MNTFVQNLDVTATYSFHGVFQIMILALVYK